MMLPLMLLVVVQVLLQSSLVLIKTFRRDRVEASRALHCGSHLFLQPRTFLSCHL